MNSDTIEVADCFTTWVSKGVRYLAIPCDAGVHIVDEDGKNYGSFLTVDRFRSMQSQSAELSRPIDGSRVRLSAQVVRP